VTTDDDDEDEFTEIPVADMVVDLRSFDVRLPDGAYAANHSNIDEGVVSETSVRELSLPDFADALGYLSDLVGEGAPEGYYLEIDPPDRIHELELREGIALESYGHDQLYATISIGLPVHADEVFEQGLETLVNPMLALSGAIGRTSTVSLMWRHEVVVMVRFESMSGRTVGDLVDLAATVRALIQAARSETADREVAVGLVLGGHASALLGQPESEWLDAKKQLWALGTPQGNAEAAKDLSAIANAAGGAILIPAKTQIVNGREVISEVGLLPAERVNLTQIRDVLRQWVFPPLPDLVTEFIETSSGRGRLLVAVGAHRSENWPHLVVGDPGAEFPVQAVSAWIRDGDRNRALSAAEIHALMRGSKNLATAVGE
jgi:hypothetical protein